MVEFCTDYKLTVNKVSTLDLYAIPKLDDFTLRGLGGKTFTELVLKNVGRRGLFDFLTTNSHKEVFIDTTAIIPMVGISSFNFQENDEGTPPEILNLRVLLGKEGR